MIVKHQVNGLEKLIFAKQKEQHVTSKTIIKELNITYPTYTTKLKNESLSFRELRKIVEILQIDSSELVTIL